jgi:signal transduction histidine kinase
MQAVEFNIKDALNDIIKSNDKTQMIGSVASVITLFLWYIIYYIYIPEQRLGLFIFHFFATLFPLLLFLNRKRFRLNGAHCRLISISFIAIVNLYMINICPTEIYFIVFLGTSSIFFGTGLLSFWPMRYYIIIVIFSAFLNILFYNLYGKLELSTFMLYNVFPIGIIALLGAYLLKSRMSVLIKKEHMKWTLEQSEKKISLMNLKTRAELDFLIYSISHDLRSPLLAVKGLFTLIKDFEKLNPEYSTYFALAEGSVDRLDQSIYDILDFADNAKIELKAESFDMREMVQEIFNDLKFLTKLPVNFQIEIEGSEMLYGDKKRLKTIIKNLAANAVKYSRIDAADAFVKFKMCQDNDQIEFQVEDNGIGILSEQHQKIFDMFYRHANDNNGSGLGLFIVKEVLSKLGGTVKLDSIEGKGSVFKISIPK